MGVISYFGIDETGSMWTCDHCGEMRYTDIAELDDQQVFEWAVNDADFVCAKCEESDPK